jgi:hypothetical protein
MEKLTISMAIFNGKLLVYQQVKNLGYSGMYRDISLNLDLYDLIISQVFTRGFLDLC